MSCIVNFREDFEQLLIKKDSGKLQNDDFTKVWCDISIWLLSEIECIIRESAHTQKGYEQKEAVVYGLLIRIFRLLQTQRRLVCKGCMTEFTAANLERLLLETSINLQYYIKNYKSIDAFRDFVLNGLKAEVYFEDGINADVQKQDGAATEWQANRLESIHEAYKSAGTSYEKLKSEKVSSPSICTKFDNTNNARLYNIAYRTKCHDVHGDWEDLAQNYLRFDECSGLFYPKFEEYRADIRQLNPILLVCCDTLKLFLQEVPGHNLSQEHNNTVENLIESISYLERLHADFLSHDEARMTFKNE